MTCGLPSTTGRLVGFRYALELLLRARLLIHILGGASRTWSQPVEVESTEPTPIVMVTSQDNLVQHWVPLPRELAEGSLEVPGFRKSPAHPGHPGGPPSEG